MSEPINDGVRGCLVPGCEGNARTRGLCATHYVSAMYLVNSAGTTWEELENKGKVLPRKSKRAKGDFQKWMES